MKKKGDIIKWKEFDKYEMYRADKNGITTGQVVNPNLNNKYVVVVNVGPIHNSHLRKIPLIKF